MSAHLEEGSELPPVTVTSGRRRELNCSLIDGADASCLAARLCGRYRVARLGGRRCRPAGAEYRRLKEKRPEVARTRAQQQRRRQRAHATAHESSGQLKWARKRHRTAWRLLKWPLVHLCLPLLMAVQVVQLAAVQPAWRVGQREEIRTVAPTAPNEIKSSSSVHLRARRSLLWAGGSAQPAGASLAALVMPANELRVSGSKSEPPSRPSVDWSKKRPHFGADIQHNVSVELGKTAYLTCKVFELGDKTVSWLRPGENEILTAGLYPYVGDRRFVPINEKGSPDWTLEIKDVTLNDSTSYECQVSTDPKMSTIINLHVKAARAKIRQGEQYYASSGASIELTCDVLAPNGSRQQSAALSADSVPNQSYWYHNGNLVNYARTTSGDPLSRSFDIDWEPLTLTSRLKLASITPSDSGNYTCKPSSAEPATVRLHVKKPRNSSRDRVHYSGGSQSSSYHVANTKEAQRNRQQYYGLDPLTAGELSDSGANNSNVYLSVIIICLMFNIFYLSMFSTIVNETTQTGGRSRHRTQQ